MFVCLLISSCVLFFPFYLSFCFLFFLLIFLCLLVNSLFTLNRLFVCSVVRTFASTIVRKVRPFMRFCMSIFSCSLFLVDKERKELVAKVFNHSCRGGGKKV